MSLRKYKLIIVFDVDGTIMRTSSGRKIQSSTDDYEVAWTPVIPTDAEVYLHTNQLGKLGEMSAKKIKAAAKLVGAIDSLVATAKDHSRKPSPFGLLEMLYGDETKPRKDDVIIFVGDAAGRDGDHSDTDLKVALNLRKLGHTAYFATAKDYDAIRFDVKTKAAIIKQLKTVQKDSDWTVTYPDMTAPQTGCFDVPTDVPDDIDLIIMCGIQGSGKSTIVNALADDGWKVVTYSSKDRTLNAVKKALRVGKVVVDGTFPLAETRELFISLSDNTMIIHVTTPPDVAKHNRLYREIVHGDKHIPDVAVSKFLKSFEKPSSDEGAKVIHRRAHVAITDEYKLYFY